MCAICTYTDTDEQNKLDTPSTPADLQSEHETTTTDTNSLY